MVFLEKSYPIFDSICLPEYTLSSQIRQWSLPVLDHADLAEVYVQDGIQKKTFSDRNFHTFMALLNVSV